MRVVLVLLLVLTALLAAGCGQKGPLYYRDKPPPGVKPPRPEPYKPVPYPTDADEDKDADTKK